MKIKTLAALVILTLAACAPRTEPQPDETDQSNYLSSLLTARAETPSLTPVPIHTVTPTYTSDPIYTAIFLVATAKKSDTPTSTPTLEPITNTPQTSWTTLPSATLLSTSTLTPQANFLPLLAHLFKNVKVYFGENKTFIFTIIGASESCPIVPSGRGVYVRYPDNRLVWMDRNLLLNSGEYFVREDDPNIYSNQITYYECK